MATHELKTWPEYFAAIKRGDKAHELRRDDRNFQAGDQLVLREWDPATSVYTGDQIRAEVTYVYRGEQGSPFGLGADYCAMSIRPLGFVDDMEPRTGEPK